MSEDLTSKLPVNHEEKLSRVLDAVQELAIRVDNLDRRVEERLYDTRPIWEHIASKVDQLEQGLTNRVDQLEQGLTNRVDRLEQGLTSKVDQLEQGLQELRQGQHDLQQESRGLKTYLRDILRRMSIFNDTLVAIQADYRDIYDRVRGLELKTEVNGQCDL